MSSYTLHDRIRLIGARLRLWAIKKLARTECIIIGCEFVGWPLPDICPTGKARYIAECHFDFSKPSSH